MRGAFALALLVAGAYMLWGWRERSFILRQGVETAAVVRQIYGDDPQRSQEVWLDYSDAQGRSHWLHGRFAAPPHLKSKVQIRYHPDRPEKALLASEPSHYDLVTMIFGLYFLGSGLVMGYRLWKS